MNTVVLWVVLFLGSPSNADLVQRSVDLSQYSRIFEEIQRRQANKRAWIEDHRAVGIWVKVLPREFDTWTAGQLHSLDHYLELWSGQEVILLRQRWLRE